MISHRVTVDALRSGAYRRTGVNTSQYIMRKALAGEYDRTVGRVRLGRTGVRPDHAAHRIRRARTVPGLARTVLALSTAVAIGSATLLGCSQRKPVSMFQIVDYREPGTTERYRESFDDAYYKLDDHGNLDLVLRRTTPGGGEPEDTLTQVLHIHSVWRSIPGRTVSHRTQLNATVTYCLVNGRIGTAYEGTGSVQFQRARDGGLTGTLDRALLRPRRRLVADRPLFARAVMTGQFHATHDPRRVVQLINQMNSLFGPPPQQPDVQMSR